MPANDWHTLVGVAIGIVVLFAAVIVLTLRFATRHQQSLLRDTTAHDVLAGVGLGNINRANLLYGVWQTKVTEVIVHVRGGNDDEVGNIVQRVLGGTITAGSDQYTMVVTSGWRESAMLVRRDNQATATQLCSYEVRGWGGGRIARYTLPDNEMLSIHARWRFAWNPAPLPVIQKGRTIGQLFDIGRAATSVGRGVVLPPSIPLADRLFILYKAEGARQASGGAR